MKPGDLVYYDKCGGPFWTVFPFSEKDARGIGMVISTVTVYEYHGDDFRSAWILDEKGSRKEFAVEYLEPVTI